jgi:cyclopropane fatty-acyl-phospholipid synthase-like methyltransferase
MTTQTVYLPSREEKSRQDFVLGLKLLANGAAQQRVREEYRRAVLPEVSRRLGSAPATREQVQGELARSAAFRQWAVLTHKSQSMMWDAIEATTHRVAPESARRMARLRGAATRRGSLELDPSLQVPAPIGNTEIHRQPGGYVGSPDPDDVTSGLRYIGASMIYSVGKGQKEAAGDGRAHVVASQLQARFPDLPAPRRILDLGCGIGVHSQAIAQAFPDAEYHAVDVAAGLLKFGHLIAEERGVPIHFHQRDAAATGFEAGSFDLVISNIMFHETNAANLPQILRECRRVLRPGGAMLHVDVATQVTRLPLEDQVMNHWQVDWNGEPFWTGFSEQDMRAQIVAAGFDPALSFADHLAKATGAWYVFGSRAN